MRTAIFKAPDISCSGCVQSIIRSLRQLSGIGDVTASAETKQVEVRFDESRISEREIRDRLEAAGYPAGE
jgi:copper chaperone CopZ